MGKQYSVLIEKDEDGFTLLEIMRVIRSGTKSFFETEPLQGFIILF